jgi:anaerobic selenocysteine-containing dehydrogenase
MAITPTTCPLDCPDACGIEVESDERRRFVRLRGNPAHGYSKGTLCGKTAIYGDLLESRDRLLTPLVRDGSGGLRAASWDDAIARIAERVRGLPGESILAAWYAGSMGICAKKFPLRAMHALGATLVDGGLCDNTASAGYEAVLGRVVGFDLERAEECDAVLLWGCDMVRTVQHLQPAVQRLCKRGIPVVAIDVYRTDTMRALERWGGRGVLLEPGTDAALALAMTRRAFERGLADREFLARECKGADDFEEHVRSGLDSAAAARICGIDEREVDALLDLLARSRLPLLKSGVGWTRRRNGGMSMRAVCSLAAVIGRAENVHYESFDSFRLDENAIERADLRPGGAKKRTIRHVELGRELESGRYRAVFIWGHNAAVTCPDSARVRSGLAREDVFTVVHEHFLTETAALADVVLPATMFPEHADIYRSYGHRRLQLARQACVPPSGPRNNVATFAAIARALDLPRETWDVTPESLCDELIAASRHRLSDAQLARLREGEPVRVEPPTPSNGRWGTPSGQIELVSESCERLGEPPMATYVPDDRCGDHGALWLISAPSVHTHNSTFSHSARHVARTGPPTCYVHPDEARARGLRSGELATLSNARAELSMRLIETTDVPRGRVRVDGLPRACDVPEGVGINALVSPAVSDLGDGNVLYSTRVELRKAERTA